MLIYTQVLKLNPTKIKNLKYKSKSLVFRASTLKIITYILHGFTDMFDEKAIEELI